MKSLGVILGLGLVFFTYFGWQSYHNSSDMKSLQDLQAGRVICSKRLSQTFTSSVLADSSSKYLSSDFMGKTEQCFKKAIDVSSSVSDRSVLKGFTNLAAKGFWLLDEVRSQIDSGDGFRPGAIQARYQVFERASQDWDSTYKKVSTKFFENMKFINNVFFVGAALITLALFGMYWLIRRQEKRINRVNSLELQKTESALPEYILNESKKTAPSLVLEGEDKQQVSEFKTEEVLVEKEPEVMPPPVPKLTDGIDFDIILSGILGSLSNKVLSSQVAINYPESDEDYWVAIERDRAYQLLYPLLNYCLSAVSEYGGSNSRIDLVLGQLQRNVVFDIKLNDTNLPLSIYRDFNSKEAGAKSLPVDLLMAKDQLMESPFVVSMEKLNEGSLVRVNMPLGKESNQEAVQSKKLVHLYKGKKSSYEPRA